MPYIEQKEREKYDRFIDNIVAFLMEIPEEDRDGHINYIVTKILKKVYQPLKYKRINRAMGVLECIKQEYYRRVAEPYETIKQQENGDVE